MEWQPPVPPGPPPPTPPPQPPPPPYPPQQQWAPRIAVIFFAVDPAVALLFGTIGGFFLGIPTLLNYLWPLWDDENRALHDMLASTRVIQA